jgi:glycosyltransferase involved in cell wall biosynthesis
MNYWPLLGIALVVIGFALRFNPLLVVVGAAVATGLLAGLDLVAVIEALAAGLPAIVSDHVSACSHIRAGQVGGVARLDADDLARELDRWLADDRMRKAAAERARPFAFENFNWTGIAGRWTGHYRRLTGT